MRISLTVVGESRWLGEGVMAGMVALSSSNVCCGLGRQLNTSPQRKGTITAGCRRAERGLASMVKALLAPPPQADRLVEPFGD